MPARTTIRMGAGHFDLTVRSKDAEPFHMDLSGIHWGRIGYDGGEGYSASSLKTLSAIAERLCETYGIAGRKPKHYANGHRHQHHTPRRQPHAVKLHVKPRPEVLFAGLAI